MDSWAVPEVGHFGLQPQEELALWLILGETLWGSGRDDQEDMKVICAPSWPIWRRRTAEMCRNHGCSNEPGTPWSGRQMGWGSVHTIGNCAQVLSPHQTHISFGDVRKKYFLQMWPSPPKLSPCMSTRKPWDHWSLSSTYMQPHIKGFWSKDQLFPCLPSESSKVRFNKEGCLKKCFLSPDSCACMFWIVHRCWQIHAAAGMNYCLTGALLCGWQSGRWMGICRLDGFISSTCEKQEEDLWRFAHVRALEPCMGCTHRHILLLPMHRTVLCTGQFKADKIFCPLGVILRPLTFHFGSIFP